MGGGEILRFQWAERTIAAASSQQSSSSSKQAAEVCSMSRSNKSSKSMYLLLMASWSLRGGYVARRRQSTPSGTSLVGTSEAVWGAIKGVVNIFVHHTLHTTPTAVQRLMSLGGSSVASYGWGGGGDVVY
jgi:hypothetical protein